MFETNILTLIFDYLLISDVSSFSSLSKKIIKYDDFYLIYGIKYNVFNSNLSSKLSLRSTRSPRLTFFTNIRLSRIRFQNNLCFKISTLLDKTDSVSQLKKFFKDFNKSENYHLFYNLNLGELMIYACYKQRWNCVKYFIIELNVNKNYQSKEGNTTVLIIASWLGNIQFVKWLFNLSDECHLDLTTEGSLQETSACGGKGPYTALEWIRRKSLVCNNSNFKKCESYLKKRTNELIN